MRVCYKSSAQVVSSVGSAGVLDVVCIINYYFYSARVVPAVTLRPTVMFSQQTSQTKVKFLQWAEADMTQTVLCDLTLDWIYLSSGQSALSGDWRCYCNLVIRPRPPLVTQLSDGSGGRMEKWILHQRHHCHAPLTLHQTERRRSASLICNIYRIYKLIKHLHSSGSVSVEMTRYTREEK